MRGICRICLLRLTIGQKEKQKNTYLPPKKRVPFHVHGHAWIYLRCMEKVKSLLPNGGLMVIYHGTK